MPSTASLAPGPQRPLGVVLAGGRGARLGGAKATVALCGLPLIEYPLRALSAVLGEVVVLAKRDTPLPDLREVAVWREPSEPHHPLFGIIHALERAAGRAVVVCAADLPLVSTGILSRLLAAPAPLAARVASRGERLQPLLARYEPAAGPALRAMLAADEAIPATGAVNGLYPERVQVEDSETLFNVNTPTDLRYAERILERRRG